MIYHRTWSDWFRMYWVVGITVKICDTDIKQFTIRSTRWYILAVIHMLFIEYKFKNKYPDSQVITWLDWKVK